MTAYIPLNKYRAYRCNSELTAEELKTIEPRCPYCGTTEKVRDHTDTCPLGELEEIVNWTQATLTALNVGDVRSGSPLHLKLRELMIAHRASAPNVQDQPRAEKEQ